MPFRAGKSHTTGGAGPLLCWRFLHTFTRKLAAMDCDSHLSLPLHPTPRPPRFPQTYKGHFKPQVIAVLSSVNYCEDDMSCYCKVHGAMLCEGLLYK